MSKHRADFDPMDERLQKKMSLDEELDALRRMREVESDRELQAEIDSFIRKRVSEIADEDREG